jgi:RNA polymerase sigma-70 factor (sigma-E family)
VAGGDERVGFESYLTLAYGPLLRFATVLTGDAHDAQDLVQTALSRTYQHWSRVGDSVEIQAYVRRIILNEFLSGRRRARLGHRLLRLTHADPNVGSHAEGHAERDALVHLIKTLPKKQKAVIVPRYYEDLNDAEIAAALGCRQSTVRSNIARALARLRVDLTTAERRPTAKEEAR